MTYSNYNYNNLHTSIGHSCSDGIIQNDYELKVNSQINDPECSVDDIYDRINSLETDVSNLKIAMINQSEYIERIEDLINNLTNNPIDLLKNNRRFLR